MRTPSVHPVIVALLLLALSKGFAAERPNILFAIADDASFPHMSAYGCKWVSTPGFDRVAREGLLFQNAYTPNAKCSPSRACILTGRNSWQLEAAANHIPYFPPKFKTYAEALSEHGYFVGKTAKGWAPGVAKDADGKRRQLTGKPFDKRRTKPPARAISASDYAANFRDFLDARPKEKPWCFWYGSLEPHRAYEYGVGARLAGKRTSAIDRVPAFWPDNERVRNDLLDYAFEIEYFDAHLVRMLDEIEKRGELDNTLVVVTADNGMPFPRAKGQAYEVSNHLPLAIMWKKGIERGGRVIEDYVSFIDFAPTFIEVAGLEWKKVGMMPSPGLSLTDIFRSEKSGRVIEERDFVLIGKERHDIGRPMDGGYPIRGVVQGGMLYVENFEPTRWPHGNPETGYLNCDGSPTKTEILEARRRQGRSAHWAQCFGKRVQEELYDLRSDPDCIRNLAADPGSQGKKRGLRDLLRRELRAQGDPRMEGRGDVFDAYPYANPGQRNFYEKYLDGNKLRAGWVNPTDFEKEPIGESGDEAAAVDGSAARWPSWRGPDAKGSVSSGSYRAEFGPGKNLDWTSELPGSSCSTPAVWGDQIFVTSPVEGKDALLSYSSKNGKELWRAVVGEGRRGKHRNGSSSNPSPVTDGERVFAYFRSGNVAGFDVSGKLLWSHNLQKLFGRDTLYWDIGTSPVIADESVVVAVMHEGGSFLVAYSKKDGKQSWKVDRNYECPVEGDHSYTTPIVQRVDDRTQVIVWGAERLTGHDAKDGSIIWSCEGFNPNQRSNWVAVASPVVTAGVAVVPHGRGSRTLGVKIDGHGDVSKTHVAWVREDIGSFVPTPAASDRHAYLVRDKGEVVCLEADSGKTVWEGQFPRHRAKYYASPVVAGDKLYATREDGVVLVARISKGFEFLAENDMGERMIASPVPVGGRILLRGEKHLFCVRAP